MSSPQYITNKNTTSNDITGDKIQTKGQLSEQGRKNFDNIDWGARAREKEAKDGK